MSRSAQRGRQRSLDRRRRYGRGQTVVEFALILPLFMLLLMAIIEFGFLFNSFLAINFASREASLVAAEAGTMGQADCLILNAVEKSITAPADRALITGVRIYRANRAGTPLGEPTAYERTGETVCTLPGGEMRVPYEVAGSPGYPPGERCNRLAGCPTNLDGVDQIGVEVSYAYGWHTPLGGVFGGGEDGRTDLTHRNVMRMEPVL